MHGHARVWSRLVRAGHETSKFWLIEAVKRTGDSVQTRFGGSGRSVGMMLAASNAKLKATLHDKTRWNS